VYESPKSYLNKWLWRPCSLHFPAGSPHHAAPTHPLMLRWPCCSLPRSTWARGQHAESGRWRRVPPCLSFVVGSSVARSIAGASSPPHQAAPFSLRAPAAVLLPPLVGADPEASTWRSEGRARVTPVHELRRRRYPPSTRDPRPRELPLRLGGEPPGAPASPCDL
jgi:hypothetical protein